MNKEEQLTYLISELINENAQYSNIDIPPDYLNQRRLLRTLMNLRPPWPISKEFLAVQNEFLTVEIAGKGIINALLLPAVSVNPNISLWQGDITTLKVDAIVNTANDRFQSTPLREGRQLSLVQLFIKKPFQSTPLREGRPRKFANSAAYRKFQSTPLREGRLAKKF